MNEKSLPSGIALCFDLYKSSALGGTVLGRYLCKDDADRAAKGNGESGLDAAVQPVPCVLIDGIAYRVIPHDALVAIDDKCAQILAKLSAEDREIILKKLAGQSKPPAPPIKIHSRRESDTGRPPSSNPTTAHSTEESNEDSYLKTLFTFFGASDIC
ncbi:MAG: hypothetical protein K2X27_23655 [Candidatus Obscuribacterales bacterium]|nr:hypothetical protein [Candidatus Obscuribacterales bacterium]